MKNNRSYRVRTSSLSRVLAVMLCCGLASSVEAGDAFVKQANSAAWSSVSIQLEAASSSPDGRYLGGVKADGSGWYSADNGKSWRPLKSIAGKQMRQAVIGKGNKVYAVASDTSIWVAPSPTAAFAKVGGQVDHITAAADGSIWGVNSSGQIWYSLDDGKNWDFASGPQNGKKWMQTAVGASSQIFAIDSNGAIWRSRNKGKYWDKMTGGLVQIATDNTGRLWGVNSGGQIWSSNDPAVQGNWKYVAAPSSGAHYVAPGKEGVMIALGKSAAASTTVAQKSANAPVSKPAGVFKPVEFQNNGATEIVIKSKEGQQPVVSRKILPYDKISIDAKLGDVFTVEFKPLNGKTYSYPTIFIVDLDAKIGIIGNPPLNDIGRANLLDLMDYSTNYYGYDILQLNRSNMAASLKPYKIFEEFSVNNTVDYSTGTGKVPMKTGFVFSGNIQGAGDSNTHMTAGYSSFSKSWGANIAGNGPLDKGGKVEGALAVDFKDVEKEEKSESNIYIYSREQKTRFDILVDPKLAVLDPAFKNDVRAVSSPAAADALLDKYGTHFNTKVTYGGERWYYAVINRDQYSKFKSTGVDIKTSVKTAAGKKKVARGNVEKTGNTGGYGVEGGVSYSTTSEETFSTEKVNIKFQALGGDGDFDTWSVNDGNSMPVAFDSARLDSLIDIRIFRDYSNPQDLKRAQKYIKDAIDRRIKKLQKVGEPKPAPKVYKVKLDRMQVTEEIDDLNKNTTGYVKVITTKKDKACTFNIECNAMENRFDTSNTYLYQRTDWNTDFKYQKGAAIAGDKEVYITIDPILVAGKWVYPSWNIKIKVDIAEQDDCIGCLQPHLAESKEISLGGLKTGIPESFDFTANAFATHAAKGSIRFKGSVVLEPSEFSVQGKGVLF